MVFVSCALLLVPFLGGTVALGDEGLDAGFLPMLLVASVWGTRGDVLALFPEVIAVSIGLAPTFFLVSTAGGRVGDKCAFELVGGGSLALFGAFA